MNNFSLSVGVVHLLGLHGYSETELDPSLDGSASTRILNSPLDTIFGCKDPSGMWVLCSAPGALHRLFRVVRTDSNLLVTSAMESHCRSSEPRSVNQLIFYWSSLLQFDGR